MAITITAAVATAVDTASTNASAVAYASALGTGSTIKIYTGTKPATPETTATGTLLATTTISGAWTGATDGTGHFSAGDPAAVSVVASGTAGWFRLATSGGTAILDGTVSTTGADLNLSSTALVSGGTVDLGAPVLTVPVTVPVS